jgi:hypothetical protein
MIDFYTDRGGFRGSWTTSADSLYYRCLKNPGYTAPEAQPQVPCAAKTIPANTVTWSYTSTTNLCKNSKEISLPASSEGTIVPYTEKTEGRYDSVCQNGEWKLSPSSYCSLK